MGTVNTNISQAPGSLDTSEISQVRTMAQEFASGDLVTDIAGTDDQIVLDAVTTPGVIQIKSAPNFQTETIRARPIPRTAIPTITLGSAAGTGATVSDVAGDDDEIYIEITTGSSPVASQTIFELTYTAAYSQAPMVIVTPANSAAWGWQNAQAKAVYWDKSSSTASKSVIKNGSTAMSASTIYAWTVRTRARVAS